MRIAFLTPTIGEAFGQEQVLHESVRLLESVGHKCLVLSEMELGPIPSYVSYQLCPDLSLVNSFSLSSFVREKHAPVLKYLSDFHPDIVHFVDLFDSRLLNEIAENYPTVLTAHSVSHTCPASHRLYASNQSCEVASGWGCIVKDWKEDCLSHYKSPLHKLHGVQNFVLKKEVVKKRFKKIIAISEFMKKVLVKDGYDPEKIEVVYNPVREQASPIFSEKKENLIVCAARLVPLKGVDHLIHSLSFLQDKNFKAWIFGEGPEKERLQALAKNLSLEGKIEFKGKVDRRVLHQAMSEAKMLVQTNLGPEGFGLSVAESMLLGTPVVAYDIPALNELILDKVTGFLCKTGDHKALAEKMERLFKEKELCKQFAEEGTKRAQLLFSCQKFLEKTEEVYREVIGADISTDSKILSSSFA